MSTHPFQGNHNEGSILFLSDLYGYVYVSMCLDIIFVTVFVHFLFYFLLNNCIF